MHRLNFLWEAYKEDARLRRRQQLCLWRLACRLQSVLKMPETDFSSQFGLDKASFRMLCVELRRCTNLRETTRISLEVKVLCTLSFLATGSHKRVARLARYPVQRTVSRYIGQVVEAITEITGKWIVFPQTQEERARIKLEFERKYQLPGVIGCVDCSHFAIKKPSTDDHLYYNRKDYNSLNFLMVCDNDLKIRYINPKFGGATEDCYVWYSSKVEPYLTKLHHNGEEGWLLGDAEFALLPWLMTPVSEPAQDSKEETYNQRHTEARKCIKQCFELLKSRWRCLLKQSPLHYEPEKAAKIVIACSVLHNIAIDAGLSPPSIIEKEETEVKKEEDSEDTENDDDLMTPDFMYIDGEDHLLVQGIETRNKLISGL